MSEVTVRLAPFVNGVFAKPQADSFVESIDPSTGQLIFHLPIGADSDVNDAVDAARTTFRKGAWNKLPSSTRKDTLHRFADLIVENAAELDLLDAEEMGKPISEARANAVAASGLMGFFAEAIDKITGDVLDSDATSFVAHRLRPRGVIAAIVPWNFPLFNAVLKIGPALAAGNSVVLKPSELASRSALWLGDLAVKAGLPPGVLNVVPGLGKTVGRALAMHSDVDMLAFTGSTEIGKRMLQYSGQSNMKVVSAECGGKCPQIVFDDGVDLEGASDAIARAILTNQGQVCSAGTRLLVERSIEEKLLEMIAVRLQQIVIGNAKSRATTFGPLASAAQCARVMQYINTGISDGAELFLGGRRALLETDGYFIEPTIFRNVSPDSRIAQEEIFGPVLSVISFKDEEQAIRIANETKYGLMAYVWTANLARAARLSSEIQSSVIVNAAASSGEGPGHAFSHEPRGHSGFGVEGGMLGVKSYMQRQLLWINYA